MSNPKLSVVVPCYNEESRIVEGFNHYWSYLKKQKYPSELIFVNDGSQDKTLELMQESAKENKNIKIISYQKNHGKGYAIVQGVRASRGDYVLFSDIDHSVTVSTVKSFLDYFNKGFDVVIASRRVQGAKILVHQNRLRETLGRGFTFMFRVLVDC